MLIREKQGVVALAGIVNEWREYSWNFIQTLFLFGFLSL